MSVFNKNKAKAIAIARKRSNPNKNESAGIRVISGTGKYYAKRKSYPKRPRESQMVHQEEESIGSKIGSIVGGGIQKLVKAITGFGDYSINENTLLTGGLSPPELVNATDNGGFIVRHREYIQDVTSSTGFVNTSFDINPGLVNSYPWLSQVADGFEQYKLRGMVYEFKSLSSDAVLSSATNSALGSVIMATQYNSIAPNFADKKTMENYEFANSDKPSCSFFHPIECKSAQTSVALMYIRTGSVPTNADQRLYDMGNFQIATTGQQAAGGVLGELWCTYEIELYKPKLVAAIGLELLTDKYALTGVTAAAPFGTSQTLRVGSNLGTTISTGSGAKITFPTGISDGVYLITYIARGTNAAITNPLWTFTNATYLQVWALDASTLCQIGNGTSSNVIMQQVMIQITGQSAVAQCGAAGTFPSTITDSDMIITQINGGIIT